MRKLLLTTLCFAAINLFAQTPKWVSTSTQTRNAILEEFTGIHCGYCPDGHKIANTIVANNPGKVFLINIHSGSYAVPSAAGDIDLRTTVGTAIDGSSGITGYPAGSMNRSTTPWAGSRSLWTSQAAGIIAQNSIVNVYVKASVDIPTRTITTEVEVYYTGSSTQSKNYLTVALTQDGILGPQSDYGNYNPTNWVNGQYLHNHVLRQFITTGTWGESIDTTTSGHYMYKKYTTVIPTNYSSSSYSDGGIALYKMNVVAYVSEQSTGKNILSGYGAAVDLPANVKTDLSLTDQTVKPTGYCFTSINPKVQVTNLLDSTITSFEASAFINGVETKKTFTGTLAKNASTTLDWGTIPVTGTGAFTMNIQGFKNINGGSKVDINELNDKYSYTGFVFKSAAFTTFKNSLESGIPQNTALDLTQNPNMLILTGSGSTSYGQFATKSALVWKIHSSWNVAGKPASMLLGEADFTTNTDPGIAFYYAYSDAGYGGTAPSLSVSVSQDCGVTWTVAKTLTCVETGQPTTAGNIYDPKPGEYIYVKTSLASYSNKKVLLKITGTPGTGGSALLVDEINVDTYTKLAVNEVSKNSNQFEIFPNPASNNFSVKLMDAKNATISVKDLTGKEVINTNIDGIESVVNCSQLKNGFYIIEVTSDGNTTSQKLLINK